MRRALQNEASSLNRVTKSLHACDAAGAKIMAAHKEGVELNPPVSGEERAAARIKRVVVFQDGECGFYGVERGAAF